MSTESYIGKGNTIEGKFDHYLKLDLTRTLVLFVCIDQTRVHSMIECLKRTIDTHNYDRRLALRFGFTHISFDRFINKIPDPSSWAFTTAYQRAGKGPPYPTFNLGEEVR
jgi:hypothetical protein